MPTTLITPDRAICRGAAAQLPWGHLCECPILGAVRCGCPWDPAACVHSCTAASSTMVSADVRFYAVFQIVYASGRHDVRCCSHYSSRMLLCRVRRAGRGAAPAAALRSTCSTQTQPPYHARR